MELGPDVFSPEVGAGLVVVAGSESTGPTDRDIVFSRASNLIGPQADLVLDTPGSPEPSEEQLWDPDRIDDWLASPPAGVEMSDVTDVEVGGMSAKQFDLTLADVEGCEEGAPCVPLVQAGSNTMAVWNNGSTMRFFWVDQGDANPLVIRVGSVEDTVWTETVDVIMASVVLGTPSPPPDQ